MLNCFYDLILPKVLLCLKISFFALFFPFDFLPHLQTVSFSSPSLVGDRRNSIIYRPEAQCRLHRITSPFLHVANPTLYRLFDSHLNNIKTVAFLLSFYRKSFNSFYTFTVSLHTFRFHFHDFFQFLFVSFFVEGNLTLLMFLL